MRKFDEKEIIIASHNPGKISEINRLLFPYGIKTLSAKSLQLPEPKEVGKTFVENAEIKARASSNASGLASLADDSGLVIPILDGDPGIYSARWAIDSSGKKKSFEFAIDKIKCAFKKKALSPGGHKAYFACALCLCWPDGYVLNLEGFVYGSITFPPRGNKGFGYDPIFIPTNHRLTFGEMSPAIKHALSHRADAFKKLTMCCFN